MQKWHKIQLYTSLLLYHSTDDIQLHNERWKQTVKKGHESSLKTKSLQMYRGDEKYLQERKTYNYKTKFLLKILIWNSIMFETPIPTFSKPWKFYVLITATEMYQKISQNWLCLITSPIQIFPYKYEFSIPTEVIESWLHIHMHAQLSTEEWMQLFNYKTGNNFTV
jgi:hypothetical protein